MLNRSRLGNVLHYGQRDLPQDICHRSKPRQSPEIVDGCIRTIPMRKLGKPEDLGPLAVCLASDAERYMTGAELVIDGANTCL
ncbi:MAG: SDR family oxidoreductase [Candidatus Saccharibacteria bacterium]|nr:SDR family oxidoreductase [Pseudorhodobacter sp.]